MTFSLCNTFNINLPSFKRRQKINTITRDIKDLLSYEHIQHKYLFNHILNKIIQLTESEYGLIGRVEFKNKKTHLSHLALSNISWNSSSNDFYRQYTANEIEFPCSSSSYLMECIENQSTVFINTYDNRRDILPEGHPDIKRCILMPIVVRESCVALIAICNRIQKYNHQVEEDIQEVVNLIRVLFV